MKRPIAWHKERFRRKRLALAKAQEYIDSLAYRLIEPMAEIDALEAQIDRAEKEGRDGFDAERFNVRRGK